MRQHRAARPVRQATATVLLVLVAACSSDGNQLFGPVESDAARIDDAIDDAIDDSNGPTGTTSRDDVERTDIPTVDCNTVMHSDDVDDALDLWNRPSGDQNSLQYSRGEVCEARVATDERVYVRLEPGTPGDFADGATLVGATGAPIDDVGSDARWFDGVDEGGLAVHQTTALGQLYFRILLGRPELDGDDRLDVAMALARTLLPRFPGVDRPAPEVVLYQADPPDRSDEGYVELLAAREASGEWTRSAGVVALLEVLVGDADADRVLGDHEPVPGSATALIGSAYGLLDSTDDTDHDAIRRLLDRIIISRQRLEAMATPPEPATTTIAVQPLIGPRRQGISDCEAVYDAPGPCIIDISIPELDATFGGDKYKLWVEIDVDSNPIGWTDQQVLWITEAMTDSATRFEAIGSMPIVDVVATTTGTAPTLSRPADDLCSINANPPLQQYGEAQFKQWIAGEFAHCFNAATFAGQYDGEYDGGAWWAAGMAIYLSNVVYPDANLEWVALPSMLAAHELGTSIGQRGPTNGMYFQDLSYRYGLVGLIDLVRQLPDDDGGKLDRLSRESDIDTLYQQYVEQLSDLGVPDSGEDPLENFYDPTARDHPIDAPASTLSIVDRFRVDRIRAIVGSGLYACMSYDRTGDARLSWRPGDVRETGPWSEDLPEVIDGTSLFAASSVSDGGSVTIAADDVVEDPDDCEFEIEDPGSTGDVCGLGCGPSDFYRP